MKDGLILMYVKDGIVYPVALTQEQTDTFEFVQALIPPPIRAISDKPQGEAVNLIIGKNKPASREKYETEVSP